MRVSDYLRDAGDGGQFFRGALGVTAGYYNFCPGVFAVDTADGGAGVLVGRGGYGTGVEDDDLGVTCSIRALEALIFKLAFDGGAVRLSCAAPKILYVKTRHHTIVAAHLGLRVHQQRIAPPHC